MLKEKIGVVLSALGVMTANSDIIIIPVALMAIGLWLMRGLVGESDVDM